MSVLPGRRSSPADPVAAPQDPAPLADRGRPPATRTSAAWIAVCTASLACVVLIVFMLQNTRQVEVTFLGMEGRLPLALALLIASVGTAILVTLIGTARITQLRHAARRRAKRT
jgi:lipopolysaccharide assembly protein A